MGGGHASDIPAVMGEGGICCGVHSVILWEPGRIRQVGVRR